MISRLGNRKTIEKMALKAKIEHHIFNFLVLAENKVQNNKINLTHGSIQTN
jgi:hypothetical protein